MKNKNMLTHVVKSGLALALGLSFVAATATAVPYACDVTNNAGVVSFRLNEAADNVKIISNGGAATNDLGPGVKGLTVTNLGVAAGHIKVVVLRSAPAGYTQTSSDGFQDNGVYVNKFEQARGLAVDKNPASPSFGRIYVANARGQADTAAPYVRTTYQGIYMINSDDTVALDTGTYPRTGGIGFTGGSTVSPFRLTVGKHDQRLYICDFSDPSGGLWTSDLDVTAGGNALAGIGDLSFGSTTHGSTYGVVVEGTTAGSDLKIWTVDEDLAPARSVWRYDVNGGSFPHEGSPTGPLATYAVANYTSKLVRGGVSNYFYFSQNRSAGTDGPSIKVFDENGVEITNSLAASRAYLNNSGAADLLRNTTSIDISPDGSTLALLRGASFGSVLLVPLTNGVFNFAGTNSFSLGTSGASENNRDIAYDAAGNLYACNTATEWFRIYSRGGATVATTGTDGSFEVSIPPILVSVSASVATANEQGPVNGQFTVTRSGDTAAPLTVNYTLTGTAVNGTDYTSIPLSLTFAAGQSTTNLAVAVAHDEEAELTETVILTLTGSANYGIGTGTATVAIVDNEPTELSIAATQATLLESFAGARATYRITRKGLTNSAVTANISYTTGTATAGVDFTPVTSTDVAAGAVTKDFNITPIDDQAYEGTETAIATIANGTGYVVGAPASATVNVIDDEMPAGTVLFQDKFDSDTSANWLVNYGYTDAVAEFGFDYSAVGIPEAPHSAGTFTAKTGLRFRVNEYSGSLGGISASPLNANFTNDYRLKFDMWMNYCGPLNDVNTVGTTQAGTAGVGTTGTVAVQPNGAQAEGVWFSATTDGQASATIGDYNAYIANTLQADDSGVYAAGNVAGVRDHNAAHYNLWVGVAAPAAQLAIWPYQTGTGWANALGMSWHSVVITKQGTNVTWDVDGRRMANVNITGVPMANNVFVGMHDPYAGVATNALPQFTLIDNLIVETIGVPPSAVTVTGLTGNHLNYTGGNGSRFVLVKSADIAAAAGSWTRVATNAVSPGFFTLPLGSDGVKMFYRVKSE